MVVQGFVFRVNILLLRWSQSQTFFLRVNEEGDAEKLDLLGK